MKTVYIVVGVTGEYSDACEWHVAVYPDREMAETHARLANEQMAGEGERLRRGQWDSDESESEYKKFIGRFALDHHAQMDYSGTKYYVVEVPFVLHPDQYMDLPRPPRQED